MLFLSVIRVSYSRLRNYILISRLAGASTLRHAFSYLHILKLLKLKLFVGIFCKLAGKEAVDRQVRYITVSWGGTGGGG